MSLVKITNLIKSFRRHAVLKQIDLELQAGDRVALIGSNGAGKTTLIRCLLGEYRYQGKILIDGLEPRQYRTEVLKKIGFVPQIAPPLKMPVKQLIRFAAAVCEQDIAAIHQIAAQLGLPMEQIKHQPFNKLSGGQKQKLLISLALSRPNRLLILDEPTANLDPSARQVFFELLEQKKEQMAMLISSHRLDEVAALVNRVLEMDQGQIVLDDHVIDELSLSQKSRVRIELSHYEAAFNQAIQSWHFQSDSSFLHWQGQIAGPDRLRFLGLLSRYAALIKTVEIKEIHE